MRKRISKKNGCNYLENFCPKFNAVTGVVKETMTEKIKISVVIPVYNAQKYLRECIYSVQKQTMNELEMICINDGSTDDSYKILKEIQRNDSRIKILSQSNQGAGTARNLALKHAKGKYICFLDADDYFLDQRALDNLYESALKHQVSICGGRFYTDHDGKLVMLNVSGNFHMNVETEKKVKYEEYQYDYLFTDYIYERELLLQHNILFPNYRRFEDPPFFVKAMTIARVFFIVDVPFYCYRIGIENCEYDENKMSQFMQGIYDNLQFSAQEGLKKLHRLTYYRILEFCNRQLKGFVLEKNPVFYQRLSQLNEVIQWEWLEERCRIKNRILDPFSATQRTVDKKLIKSQREDTEKWILPYEYLENNSKVALYGAGDVGRSYFRQLHNSDCYFLRAWADKNYDKISVTDYELISPEQLLNIDFDILIIGVAEIEMAMDIMDNLTELGIPAQKLVWDIGR